MKFLIVWIITLLGRMLFSLRYKVEIKDKENLRKSLFNRKGGTLFLPNHPAYLDPILVFFYFWPQFRMRPMAVEYVFRQKTINIFMRLVRAIPIPDFETSVNEIKLRKAEESLKEVVKGLHKRDSFLLYPGGKLKLTGKETLGGASATYDILKACPDSNVVLIRTTGLWGSAFSRAISPGKNGNFIFKLIKVLFKNLIFFCKRRKITIEAEVNPKDFPFQAESKLELNGYLEKWYNRYTVDGKILEEEPINLVSYSFFRNQFPTVKRKKSKRANEDISKNIPVENRELIYKEIAKLSEIPVENLNDDMALSSDVGLDSLDAATMIVFVTDHFEAGEVHPGEVETIRDLLEASVGKEFKGNEPEEKDPTHKWPKEKRRGSPEIPAGKTIMEAFLRTAERMGNNSALADDIVGVLSYSKLKKAVLVLALEFKKIPNKHVGVLLPASAGAYIVILAIMMANKTPVMLNWTLGHKFLNDTLKQTKTETVISSWKFLEKLSNVDFGDLIHRIKLLEDIKGEIKLTTKLKGAFRSLRSYQTILKKYKLDKVKEDADAVILFTSGTEAAPKGVPLTHKNILANLFSSFHCLQVFENDILYGILPPFHSFGFSVTGIFPIVSGFRAAYYPDPTDGFALAKGISRWGVTLVCAAPTFLAGLLHSASKWQLASVRIFISGAEKASDDLYERVKALGGKQKLLEGYGITECSPILSLNRFNRSSVGVGQLIPCVEMVTVHPETLEPLPTHSEGEICVRGPNIFRGYLGQKKSPFIEIHGEMWYRTGDLGYLDDRHNLILSGRLKRFVKIGGEMVSLGSVESVFVTALKSGGDDEKPYAAIIAIEHDETRASIILVTTRELDKIKANQFLRDAGISNLVKISDVKKVAEIPIMGTGKINYRAIQSEIENANT